VKVTHTENHTDIKSAQRNVDALIVKYKVKPVHKLQKFHNRSLFAEEATSNDQEPHLSKFVKKKRSAEVTLQNSKINSQ